MAWDATKPGGGDTFPPSDDAIRDNWAYLAAALQEISSFAANPSDPTLTQLKLDTGVLASRPATGVTGQVYFATDTGQLFVYNAAWVEITRLGSALTLAGAVSMLSTLTATGLITANGGITLAAGQKLTVPSESYLRQGSIDLRVHAHKARHIDIATEGVDGAEFDYIPRIPRAFWPVFANSPLVYSAPAPVFIDDGSGITLNFTGRRTDSIVWLFATFTGANSNGAGTAIYDILMDGASVPGSSTNVYDTGFAAESGAVIFLEQAGVTPASHTWRLRCTTAPWNNGGMTWHNRRLVVIDMGTEA